MKESQKPNDILVATINAPDATLMELIQNDINASNTQLLTMDEYKQSKFIQDKFTKDGTFDNNAFEQYYLLAASKLEDLRDDDIANKLQKEIKWDPNSLYKPIDGSQDLTNVITFNSIKNPHKQTLGLVDFNTWSEAKYTAYEEAQMHKIWDSENQKWLDYTPEEMSLFDKFLGTPLRYAKYQDDEYNQYGVLVHRKGEFKTDENGSYYTETMPKGEQLMDSEIVKVADIITSEGSMWNSINVFEGDDKEKSVAGTAIKTILTVAPYLTPWGGTLGAITGLVGLASALPTIYKSFSGMLGGKDSKLFQQATDTENWLQKFGTNVSVSSRDSFWNFEQLMSMGSDVFGQLHQQRAAGRLAQYFKKVNKADYTDMAQYAKDLRKQSELAQKLSLGYMALTSATDVYNQSREAGYSDEASGLISLASMGALYGIMRFNESARGIGTWMLDKTTGYSQEVNSKGIFKAFKPIFDEINNSYQAAIQTGKKDKLILSLRKFMQKAKYQSFGLWSGAIVEGTEEVTEEAIQDVVKAMADASVAMGLIQNEGKTFGGFSNVFSKEGLDRYLSTFVGGAIGGAIFDLQMNVLPGSDPNLRRVDHNLAEAYLNGTLDLVIKEVDKYCKKLDNGKSPNITKIGDQEIQLSTNGQTSMQMVAKGVIDRILTLKNSYDLALSSAPIEVQADPKKASSYLVGRVGLGTKGSAEFSDYISTQYTDQMNAFAESKLKLNETIQYNTKRKKSTDTEEQKPNEEEVKTLEKEVQTNLSKVRNFFNGINGFRFSTQFNIHQMAQSGSLLFKQHNDEDDGLIYARTPKDWAWFKYHKNFNDLKSKDDPDYNPQEVSREQVEQEQADIVRDFKENKDKFSRYLEEITDIYLDNQKSLSKKLNLLNTDKIKEWLRNIDFHYSDDDTEEDKQRKNNILTLLTNTDTTNNKMRYFLDALSAEIIKTNPAAYNNIQNLLYMAVSDALVSKRDEDGKLSKGIYTIDLSAIEGQLKAKKNTATSEEEKAKIKTLENKLKRAEDLINTIVDVVFSRVSVQGNWTEEMIDQIIKGVNETISTKTNRQVFNQSPALKELDSTIDEINQLVDQIFVADDGTLLSVRPVISGIQIHKRENQDIKEAVDKINNIRAKALLDYLQNTETPYTGRDVQAELSLFEKNIIIPDIINYLSESGLTLSEEQAQNLANILAFCKIQGFDGNDIQQIETAIQDTKYKEAYDNLKNSLEDGQIEWALPTLLSRNDNKEIWDIYSGITSKLDSIEANNKNIGENPIYDLITDFLYKVQENDKSVTIFEYLFNKNLEINNLRVLDNFNLNKEEAEQVLQDFKNAFMSLLSTLQGSLRQHSQFMGVSIAMPTVNDQIKEYAKTFGLSKEQVNPDDYVSIDSRVYNSILLTLEELTKKVEFIIDLYKYKITSKITEDRDNEIKISKALIASYNKLLPTEKHFHVDIDDYDELIKATIEAKNQVCEYINNEIKASLEGLSDAQKEKTKKDILFKYFGILLENGDSLPDPSLIVDGFIPVSKAVQDNGSLNPYYALMDFITTISSDHGVLLQLYKESIGATDTDEVARRFDQFTAFSMAYSSLLDENGYFKVLDSYLQDKLKESGNKVGFIIPSSMTFVTGTTGSGKSSVIAKSIVSALQKDSENTVLATSTSEKKAKDFREQIGIKDPAEILDIYGDNGLKAILNKLNKIEGADDTALSANIDKIKRYINDVRTFLSDPESFKIEVKDGETEYEINVEGVCTITMNYTSSTVSIANIEFSEDFNKTLKNIIDNLESSDKNFITLAIDESTKLDIVTLYILNKLQEQGKAKVLLVGDEFQMGNEASIHIKKGEDTSVMTFNMNTDLFYSRRTPYMSQPIRCENTGNTTNLNNIVSIINGAHIISPVLNNSIDVNETTKFAKEAFNSTPLIYKYELEETSPSLMGHQVVTSEEEQNKALEALKNTNAISTDNKLKVLVGLDYIDQVDNIKTSLEAIFGENTVEVFKEGDQINDIQGDESDYVLLYNLKYYGDENPDTNLKSVNTYASRAKKFTLIVEIDPNSLFSQLKITSKEDQNIGLDTFVGNDIKDLNSSYYSIIQDYLKTKSAASSETTTIEPEETEEDKQKAQNAEAESFDTEGSNENLDTTDTVNQENNGPKSVIKESNGKLGVFELYFKYLGPEFDVCFTKDRFDYSKALEELAKEDNKSKTTNFLGWYNIIKRKDYPAKNENELKQYINEYFNHFIISLLYNTDYTYELQQIDGKVYGKPLDGKFGESITSAVLVANYNGSSFVIGSIRSYDEEGRLVYIDLKGQKLSIENLTLSLQDLKYKEDNEEKNVITYTSQDTSNSNIELRGFLKQITRHRVLSIKRSGVNKLYMTGKDIQNNEITLQQYQQLGYEPVKDSSGNVTIYQFKKGNFDEFKKWYNETYQKNIADNDTYWKAFENIYYEPALWIAIKPINGYTNEQLPLMIYKHPKNVELSKTSKKSKTYDDTKYSLRQFFNFLWYIYRNKYNESHPDTPIEGNYLKGLNGNLSRQQENGKKWDWVDGKLTDEEINILKDKINKVFSKESGVNDDVVNFATKFITYYTSKSKPNWTIDFYELGTKILRDSSIKLGDESIQDLAKKYFKQKEFLKEQDRAKSIDSLDDYLTAYVPEPPRFLIKIGETQTTPEVSVTQEEQEKQQQDDQPNVKQPVQQGDINTISVEVDGTKYDISSEKLENDGIINNFMQDLENDENLDDLQKGQLLENLKNIVNNSSLDNRQDLINMIDSELNNYCS